VAVREPAWHCVGPLDDFPSDEPREVRLDAQSLVILRCDDAIHAFRNECPHQGAPLCSGRFAGTMVPSEPGTLEYGLRRDVIRCPWHGWEFRVSSGQAVFGISSRRLAKYETDLRGGDVYVRLPRLHRAAAAETSEGSRT
jgi:nitrite reductase (NADH) small subunit